MNTRTQAVRNNEPRGETVCWQSDLIELLNVFLDWVCATVCRIVFISVNRGVTNSPRPARSPREERDDSKTCVSHTFTRVCLESSVVCHSLFLTLQLTGVTVHWDQEKHKGERKEKTIMVRMRYIHKDNKTSICLVEFCSLFIRFLSRHLEFKLSEIKRETEWRRQRSGWVLMGERCPGHIL